MPLLLAVSMPVQMCLGTHTHNGGGRDGLTGRGMVDGDWGRWGSGEGLSEREQSSKQQAAAGPGIAKPSTWGRTKTGTGYSLTDASD